MRNRRRLGAAAFCLVILFTASQGAEGQTCVAPPSGLVGWWPGNGTAQDALAGNDGQLAGDATFAPAVVGQGFRLDGFGDFVEIPDSSALKPAQVSVEAWVRFDSLDTPIVSQFGAVGLQYIVYKKQRQANVDRFVFSVADLNGFGGNSVASSTTSIVVGQFYHVVGTYDGSAVKVYVNGILEGQALVSLTIDYGTRPLFIGTSGETVFDGKLNGIVDEASIYNRALDASEVADLHAAGTAGKCISATGLITKLAAFVQTLNVSNGVSNSLDVKLQNALQALDDASAGNVTSACNRMQAFLNEVKAQTGNTLTESQATQLAAAVGPVRAALGCR
jgi:hypothetical protein